MTPTPPNGIEKRRHARRRTDPPVVHNPFLGFVVQNPVLAGMTIALAVAALALALVLNQQSTLRRQQHQLASFTALQQRDRARTVGVFCAAINSNAVVLNHQTDYLKALLLTGAKSSKPFERVYRQFGLPDYAHRLANAERQAAGLERRKVPILNCNEFRARADAARPPSLSTK